MEKLRTKLIWEPSYELGFKKIDEQHKGIFNAVNDLIDCVNCLSSEEPLQKIIDSLAEYKEFHFKTEEKYFKEFEYEGSEEHVLEHKKFNDKINELHDKHANDSMTYSFELLDFLEDWLLEHIAGMDQKYKQCFKKHGLI